MDNNFNDFTWNINRLNSLFLDNIELKLKSNGINNVNSNQALLIKNIGYKPTHVNDANSLGFYVGTNISYNVKDMVKKGYINRITDNDDKRCAFLVLTKKGKKVLEILEGVNVSHQQALQKLKIDVNNINEILLRLQRIF